MTVTQKDLEYISMKEAKYDFLETDQDLSPINKPMVRIAEQAQTFTALDIYKAKAQLDLSIEKAKQDLEPKIFKNKIANLKKQLEEAIEAQEKQRDLLIDEIKILEDENGLNINVIEREYQEAVQKRLQEEANQSTE
jgi:hypothetical protein